MKPLDHISSRLFGIYNDVGRSPELNSIFSQLESVPNIEIRRRAFLLWQRLTARVSHDYFEKYTEPLHKKSKYVRT